MPRPPFIDWAPVDRRGECAALNAIFYGALEAFAGMARPKGDRRSLEEVEEVMGLMRESFQRRFFNPNRGCFADATASPPRRSANTPTRRR